MSLRPNLCAFDLKAMQALIGSKDAALIAALTESWTEEAEDDEHQPQIPALFKRIVDGDVLRNPPAVEDEDFPNAMIWFATHSQSVTWTESSFWEAFLVDVDHTQGKYPGGPELLLSYLLKGRPLFGKSIETYWSYYAYFTNAEAKKLFGFIRGQSKFKQQFDYEEAEFWMTQVEQTGSDVWYFAY